MIVLIDNGHGVNTPGKCSPDKRLLEWKWTREIAVMVANALKAAGVDARRIVTEDNDITLRERCRRVNEVCAKYGSKNVVLVSIHVNAAGGDGKWHDARGFSVWVSKKGSNNSKRLAQLMYDEAERLNLKGNRYVPKERYWQSNFTIITDTYCPAVLTENLFQDNMDDVDFLLSDEGKKVIVDMHVSAIQKYIGK
ncbi:MAG: N-acetylmuramoyl-L-alanine amidase [Bacteroidales bacterium]|nr:N-acetylmuramoyl-L-alanine amidase [Bacteroidales bacterium]